MRKIVFLTGTRADFGKIKALIQSVESHKDFEPYIFVTGMHLIHEYGYTVIEVERCGFKNISKFHNHTDEATMDLTLAKTINGFSAYIKEIEPDLIVIHGDRVEALAGAIVGSLNNVLVAHIEGGELSGTIDELIRHSVSKLSHIHYTSNDEAKNRLIQMGELEQSIFTIGSPDVDIMFSNNLPTIDEVKAYYQIEFMKYGVAMFHPVTTEIDTIKDKANQFVDALIESGKNYVVIYPNNDLGSKYILGAYERLKENNRFKIFPSIRFEYFLTLLKKSDLIIGNSSAGVREAPYYGISTINIGNRQLNRASSSKIINVPCEKLAILKAFKELQTVKEELNDTFGKGDSAQLFLESIESSKVWSINHQKQFKDA
ncbi:UDP-N-acetylglucosamine 2-epimerase (hydrolyzing) [Winogradskyella echinorum]|uniref:UDP-N-acetylglucosamine 2-epimerase (Hydrolyzing) n=1 Tax=Winogradskyella echinorum TaxID=538189 RepID=A0ABR6Y2G7_9FLAO|nr:UDP-N-acetylglucosamine 2-epimerase [Winogradskyella echinorum]MBC3846942.1 UDP-N-acetylglucosamine 2-epimerase (hydrolyzing) [Winogradskyella echinorum]MBC5751290.1 UDP-N-acetylglucosamine 2-epimerase (hydrolyzing) [Winogradskyella echinorum]